MTIQIKPLPFKEVKDGVKRKHSFVYGCPRPLVRVEE